MEGQPSIEQVIKELRRELGVRRGVYPGWIDQKKLSETTANHRVACIEQAIKIIETWA